MGFIARAAVLAVLASFTTAGGFVARKHFAPVAAQGAALPGVKVDGATLTAGENVAALVHSRALAFADRRIDVVIDGEPGVFESKKLADLGAHIDEEETVARITQIGQGANLYARYVLATRAKKGQIDVPLVIRLDDARAFSAFEAMRDKVDRHPISARLDLDKHAVVAETPGRYVATFDAVTALEQAAEKGEATLTLPVREAKPRVSSAFLKDLDIGTVVSSYETYFSRQGDQKRRGKNIDNAAARMDGVVLFPGELVSFNQIVGERSEENGFQKSWEIYKGEMVEGIGGGTCQVASTFHAAVFFGGLDVLERLPHSRPSAYIPMGLDSTVVYPSVDLKIRNPHPFPIVIHAKTTDNTLTFELLGKEKPVAVGFGRELLETLPYPRKVVEDPALSGKKVLVKQHGIRGYKIKRSRVLSYKNGTQRTENVTDTYPPTTEIYAVPPGFDETLLPALPEAPKDADANSAGNTASATPAASPSATAGTTSTATASADPPPSDLTFVDGPGSHAPTTAQANPAKTIWLRR